MPLIVPGSSSNNQGGGSSSSSSSGGLGPLSRIYAEYEHSKKKPTAAKKRSRSSAGSTLHHVFGGGHVVAVGGGGGEKKRRSLLALQDHPNIWKNNNTNVNNMGSVVAAVDEKPPKQHYYSSSSANEEKMALPKKKDCATAASKPTPCSYVNGCTDKSIKDGLCKTHWCAVNLCPIDGCSKLAWSKGFCRGHFFSTNVDHPTTLGMGKTVGGEAEGDSEMSTEDNVNGSSATLQLKEEVAPIEVNESHKKQQQKQIIASGATKQSTTPLRKPCIAEGCSNQSVVNGVCFRHGAKRKLCDTDGCTNHSIRGGVCFRHGAKRKLCKVDGCTNLTQRRGVCVRHGAFIVADAEKKIGNSKVDEDENESNEAKIVGRPVLCVEIPPSLSKSSSELQSDEETHLQVPRSVSASSTETLSINAAASEILVRRRPSSSSDEFCPPLPNSVTKGCTKTKGGRKVKSCKTEGCTNRAIQGGQCFRHGAKAHRKVCSSEGCKNYVVKAGVCIKHGARQASKKNAEEEPTKSLKQEYESSASEDDTDKKGRKAKTCKTEGCTNRAIQGGQCFRHGAKAHRKLCSSEGCKNYVVKAGVCIKHGARQASKKNADEEPKYEESLVDDNKSVIDCATQITSLKQDYESSASQDDLQNREQDELFESIDRMEGSCANILLLLKNDR